MGDILNVDKRELVLDSVLRTIKDLMKSNDASDFELDQVNETTVFEECGLDSLDMTECISSLEYQYHIEMDLQDLEKIDTVKDIVDLIMKTENN